VRPGTSRNRTGGQSADHGRRAWAPAEAAWRASGSPREEAAERRHAGCNMSARRERAVREAVPEGVLGGKVRTALRRQARSSARSMSLRPEHAPQHARSKLRVLIRRGRSVCRAAERLLRARQPTRQAGGSVGVECTGQDVSSQGDALYTHMGSTADLWLSQVRGCGRCGVESSFPRQRRLATRRGCSLAHLQVTICHEGLHARRERTSRRSWKHGLIFCMTAVIACQSLFTHGSEPLSRTPIHPARHYRPSAIAASPFLNSRHMPKMLPLSLCKPYEATAASGAQVPSRPVSSLAAAPWYFPHHQSIPYQVSVCQNGLLGLFDIVPVLFVGWGPVHGVKWHTMLAARGLASQDIRTMHCTNPNSSQVFFIMANSNAQCVLSLRGQGCGGGDGRWSRRLIAAVVARTRGRK
jgi:hypothetical protein